MEQKFETISNKEEVVKLDNKIEEVLEHPATRIVNLYYKSCCGCGCHDIKINREVAWDSPLKNGEYAKNMDKTDKEGWK